MRGSPQRLRIGEGTDFIETSGARNCRMTVGIVCAKGDVAEFNIGVAENCVDIGSKHALASVTQIAGGQMQREFLAGRDFT